MYAIIEACGKQYKVQEGDIVFMERLNNDEGATVTFDNVLLVSKDGKTTVGAPTIKNAKVTGVVVGHGKGKKILVFKYKAKKNERKARGHRACYTRVQIEKISVGTSKAKKEEVAE
jgi:large subunit ribosomal protein L21